MEYAIIYVLHISSIQITHITNAKKNGTPNHFSIFYDQNDTKEIETERREREGGRENVARILCMNACARVCVCS
jgi:hypothetical protein